MTMTLLADYGIRARLWIPSGAVVDLLGEFGITAGSTRAALSRLARGGVLERHQTGRRTAYRLTPGAAEGLALGGAAIAGFPAEAEAWDGQWTVITFSLPEAGDSSRRALRQQLRFLGFAPLYDALWVSPLPLRRSVHDPFASVGPGWVTVFRACWVGTPGAEGLADRDPLSAWDLPGITRQYEEFIDRWSRVLIRLTAGDLTGVEALHARTEVMDTYRHFLALDPRVPLDLMPAGWPRREAQEVFTAIYDGLLPASLEHVRQSVARYSEAIAPDLQGHTVADMTEVLLPKSDRDVLSPAGTAL
jgi:phenylacetic acid degradation operon negative regulatory protein